MASSEASDNIHLVVTAPNKTRTEKLASEDLPLDQTIMDTTEPLTETMASEVPSMESLAFNTSQMDIDPRYIYTNDFEALAKADGEFEEMMSANERRRIDFTNPVQLRQVTRSLLKADFKLELDLPPDRLCPPVMVRYEYVRWIQQLLDSTDQSLSGVYDRSRPVKGLDIGVGASNIYSLLALRSRPSWYMYGTDIDETSLEWAKKNTEINSLTPKTRLILTKRADALIPLRDLGTLSLDFVMCNPPFFDSFEQREESASGEYKDSASKSACSGSDCEMITPGGDFGFVCDILELSLKLRTKVQWYSSMFGFRESMEKVAAKLKPLGITNYAVATLRTTGKTRRWCLAWSFHDLRPADDVVRHEIDAFPHIPFPTAFKIRIEDNRIHTTKTKVSVMMTELDVQWTWKTFVPVTGVGLSHGNVWSRFYRREKKRRAAAGISTTPVPSSPEEAEFAFKITVERDGVVVAWLKGNDQTLYESFCGVIKRGLVEQR